MNDELSGKLAEILGAMQLAVGQAKDFTLAQLPDIAQSYVAYGRAWSTFLIVISIVALIVIALVAMRIVSKNDDYADKGFIGFIAVMVSIVPTLALITSMKNAMLVWFAPKVWLLIKMSELIRGG